MFKLAVGFVLGVVVGQVGFQGIARIMDQGVATVQQQATELSQENGKESYRSSQNR